MRACPRATLRCLLLAALAGAARGAFTCATTDNATTCAVLGQIYAATSGATTWLSAARAAGWSAAASGTNTSYCNFAGITGGLNPLCVAGAATPHFTTLCVHAVVRRSARANGRADGRSVCACPTAQGAVRKEFDGNVA